MATPHPGGFIAVLPPPDAKALREKIAAIKYNDIPGQRWAARFSKASQAITFDKAGRVILKKDLLDHAGIGKAAILVGAMNKFNIYSPEAWAREESGPAAEVTAPLDI